MRLPYNIESNRRYQTLDQFTRDHPGQVKNMVGHSKGAAVVDVWKKNNADCGGKAYGTARVSLEGGVVSFRGRFIRYVSNLLTVL
jgi:hypothetical protein